MNQPFFHFFLFLITVIIRGTSVTGLDDEAGKEMEFTILAYNVRNCRGLDNITDYQRVADIINRIDPSIVALQELDSVTQRSSGVAVLDELARLTGMYPVYGASIPFQGGKYGVGILTKEKPLQWRSVPLPGREEKRSLLIVELKDVIICCTHFSLTEEDRMESAVIINGLFNESGKPVFLTGDLNATPESEVIRKIEEKWTMLNDRNIPTFPADNPDRCIDYIFILKGTDAGIRSVKARVEHEPVASDHLPVWIRVKVRGRG
jgi:endonuclease/exonuclease/phosphatase family metal-dependent hydrolase